MWNLVPCALYLHVSKCRCVARQVTDADLLRSLDKTLGNNDRYSSRQTNGADKELERNQHFRVKHFAGTEGQSFVHTTVSTALKRGVVNVIQRVCME